MNNNFTIYYIKNQFEHLALLNRIKKDPIAIECIDNINQFDLGEKSVAYSILILSGSNNVSDSIKKNFSSVIVWDTFMEEAFIVSKKDYFKHYDYHYLHNSLINCKNPGVESLIIGSSYARFGIDESKLKESCINMALPSQDIYYACLIARTAINSNPNIKKVYIGSGYYSFYNDLSKTSAGELQRIFDVYYPILHDLHNYMETLPLKSPLNFPENYSEIFSVEKVMELISYEYYQMLNQKYYIAARDRSVTRISMPGTEHLNWHEVPKEIQESYARDRALKHNKALSYESSFEENIKTFNLFVSYCNSKNITIVIIAFPSTKYYNKYLDRKFKQSYLNALNRIEGLIHFIDLNDFDIYDDKDFIDMDHLNEKGAIKTSELINRIDFNLNNG
jgi:hypothetical protein